MEGTSSSKVNDRTAQLKTLSFSASALTRPASASNICIPEEERKVRSNGLPSPFHAILSSLPFFAVNRVIARPTIYNLHETAESSVSSEGPYKILSQTTYGWIVSRLNEGVEFPAKKGFKRSNTHVVGSGNRRIRNNYSPRRRLENSTIMRRFSERVHGKTLTDSTKLTLNQRLTNRRLQEAG